MTSLAVVDNHAFWTVALGIGAVVIVVVVILMVLLLSFLRDIAASVTRLLEVGGEVAANTAAIPQLADTGPVLEMIRDEALVHDSYLGQPTAMSTGTYVFLSVAEAVLLIAVLAVALIRIRQRLEGIAAGLARLGAALRGVERDVELIGQAVPSINAPLSAIVGALPGIAQKAETVARR